MISQLKGCARRRYQVFVSHSSVDTWVASQLADEIRRAGATCFLDAADIDHGDDFDRKIRAAAMGSRELLVLLTPWAALRPFLWLEVGAFWGSDKRVVAVLHGLTPKEVAADERLPVFLKKSDVLVLNDISSYFTQLRRRVATCSGTHA